MNAPRPDKKRKRFKVSPLLGLDAWIDSTLYETRFRLAEFWEDTTIFFRRFHVTGWRRAIFEVLGEAFTWGTVGSVLMLTLAIPAFHETE